MTDEEYVRANWERVHLCDGSYGVYPRGTVLMHSPWFGFDFPTWAAAAEFTRERLEQMRQLEGEMQNVLGQIDRASRDCRKVVDGDCCTLSKGLEGAYAACAYRFARIYVRLESALTDLKRGMANPTCPSLTDPAATP